MYTFVDTAEPDIAILDQTGLYRPEIRDILKEYKKRWGSVASRIVVVKHIKDLPRGKTVIIPTYAYGQVSDPLKFAKVIMVEAINLLTVEELRAAAIEVLVEYTKDIDEARDWLYNLPDIFTYDSETTGLEHPSREEITMYSFGLNDETAFVVSNENQEMQDMVMEFLTTTEKTMIIHNFQFDGKWIRYLTGKYPKSYEDTQLLAWTYLNHADVFRAKVSLKALAKSVYRDWAVSADLFGIEHKHNPDLIYYAGVDAAATWFVYNKYTKLIKGESDA